VSVKIAKVSLIVKVYPDLAHMLHRRQRSSGELKELLKLEKDLDITLKPMHPSTKDGHLVQYFRVQVGDRSRAERIKERLLHCRGVEAAYFKPSDELATNSYTLGGLP
jgi:hypothetical protein